MIHFDKWQKFRDGTGILLSRPLKDTTRMMGREFRPTHDFHVLLAYREVVNPPVENVNSLGVIEGFTGKRAWAVRQKAVRFLRKMRKNEQ